jgi:hypothetical protein
MMIADLRVEAEKYFECRKKISCKRSGHISGPAKKSKPCNDRHYRALFRVEDRDRTGDLWNHNPAL